MLKFQIEHSLRYRVAVALATFSIFIVGTLCIILYFASDKIEEAHIEQVIQMEMDHLVHRYQKHSDFISGQFWFSVEANPRGYFWRRKKPRDAFH